MAPRPAASITTEAPIHVSNVMVVDGDGKPTRVGKKLVEDEDGKSRRVRISRRSGKEICHDHR